MILEDNNGVDRVNNIDDILKKYGLKESTIVTLYEYSNDIAEKIIAFYKIPNDNYEEIGKIMGKYHLLFVRSVEKGLEKFIEKEFEFSDYDVIMMAEKLRDATIKYIDTISFSGSSKH